MIPFELILVYTGKLGLAFPLLNCAGPHYPRSPSNFSPRHSNIAWGVVFRIGERHRNEELFPVVLPHQKASPRCIRTLNRHAILHNSFLHPHQATAASNSNLNSKPDSLDRLSLNIFSNFL